MGAYGFAGNDTLTGGSGVTTLFGGEGEDTLNSGTGSTTLLGGAGADVFNATSTQTTVIRDLGNGMDTLTVSTGGKVTATLASQYTATATSLQNAGQATLETDMFGLNLAQASGPNGYTIVATPVASEVTPPSNLTLEGSVLDDQLQTRKNTSNVLLLGGLGNDAFNTEGSGHTLTGGAGTDSYTVSSSNTVISMLEQGEKFMIRTLLFSDNASITAFVGASGYAASADSFNNTGSASAARIIANGGTIDFSLTPTDITNVGGYQVDVLSGTSIAALSVENTVATSIKGSKPADSLTGGLGADSFYGGSGNDTLTGGEGTDLFVFESTSTLNGNDTIKDFAVGSNQDILDFSAFGLDGNATATVGSSLVTTVYTANPGASVDSSGKIVRLVDIANGSDITTESGLTTALQLSGEYSNIDLSTGKAIFITSSSSNPGTNFVFYASLSGSTINATLVGTLSNVDIDGFVNNNFLI